ncbi:transglutaminase domain-containing protein [Candidatus Woesearchaeota archaeon]|nr:transglutaminase domain-containing protein [Candidatus Woesearchaeota archaeon]
MFSFAYSVEVGDEWIYRASNAILNVSLNSSVEIISGEDAIIKDLEITSLFFPKTTMSTVVKSVSYFPKIPLSEDDSLVYKFKSPDFDRVSYGMSVIIENTVNFHRIEKKIDYPISAKNVPPEYWIYLQPAKNIDSDNKSIKLLAQKLVGNEDDLYDVAYILAEWVNENINYVVDSATADVSERASWVLKYRKGVCDELTSLYIALLRSVGVPARYVSGIAYTNLDIFDTTWGFHGWAQVYFPEYGWIDFDPTYGQMGYVDVSHIPLKFSVDSGEAATKFSMKTYDARLKTFPMSHSVDIIDVDYDLESDFKISTNINSERYGFGSYGLLVADVENKAPFYNTITLLSGKTTNLKVIGREEKPIILHPYESKKLYWIFKIDDEENFDTNSEYVFPLIIYDFYGNTYEERFFVNKNYPVFDFETVNNSAKKIEEELGGFTDIEMLCISDKSVYYEYEPVNVNCTFENLVSSVQDFTSCFDGLCENVTLGPNELKSVNFGLYNFIGKFIDGLIYVDVTSELESKKLILPISVLPMPNVTIQDIIYPEELKYGQGFELSFKIVPISDALYYGNLILLSDSFSDSWNFSFSSIKPFKLQMNSESFIDSENDFRIILNYRDFNGYNYTVDKSFKVHLVDLSFSDRINLLFSKIGISIISFFDSFFG